MKRKKLKNLVYTVLKFKNNISPLGTRDAKRTSIMWYDQKSSASVRKKCFARRFTSHQKSCRRWTKNSFYKPIFHEQFSMGASMRWISFCQRHGFNFRNPLPKVGSPMTIGAGHRLPCFRSWPSTIFCRRLEIGVLLFCWSSELKLDGFFSWQNIYRTWSVNFYECNEYLYA